MLPPGLRLRTARLHPPTVRARRFVVGSLASLLLVGCSSAADAYPPEAGTDTALTEPPATTYPATTNNSGSGTNASASAGDTEAGGDEAGESTGSEPPSDSGGDPGGESEPEPVLDDLLESQDKLIPGCDLETAAQYALRTLDGAAAASPAQARDAALSGWLSLTGIRIRPWEFFNYYGFDYPSGPTGGLAVTPQLAALPGDAAHTYELQLGVRSHALVPEQRPAVHLTLALDNSGSMEGKALDLARAAGKAIASRLRAGDTVSISTWNAKYPVLLEAHAVSGPDDPLVLARLDEMQVGGTAELYSGLTTAYKLAEATHEPGAWNPVVLVSDGGATANEADLDLIADHAADQNLPGSYLVGLGVGDAGIYRSDLMDAVAHAGRGASLFVGSEAEAGKLFGGRFDELLGVAVRDVEVHLELPPGFEVVRDLEVGGYDDGTLTPGAPRLGPGGRLVLHRRLRSCAAPTDDAKLGVRVAFVDEQTGEKKEVTSTVKLAELLADKPAALAKGGAVWAYAAALQRWQARPADLMAALALAKERLDAALELLPNDPELAEIGAVLAALNAG